jgi:hypothetical protein
MQVKKWDSHSNSQIRRKALRAFGACVLAAGIFVSSPAQSAPPSSDATYVSPGAKEDAAKIILNKVRISLDGPDNIRTNNFFVQQVRKELMNSLNSKSAIGEHKIGDTNCVARVSGLQVVCDSIKDVQLVCENSGKKQKDCVEGALEKLTGQAKKLLKKAHDYYLNLWKKDCGLDGKESVTVTDKDGIQNYEVYVFDPLNEMRKCPEDDNFVPRKRVPVSKTSR